MPPPRVAGEAADRPVADRPCAPDHGLNFICGPVAAEDLVALPDSPWIVTSGLNVGHPATLSLVDRRSGAAAPLAFASSAAPAGSACPGPIDPARMSLDGLALRAGPGGRHRLYASNHGDRRAIEMFDVALHGGRPVLTWIDCAPMPAHTMPNAVTVLPGGAFAATSFYDPDDKQAWQRMARGEATGGVFVWRPGAGFAPLAGSAMSGANGIAASADGRTLYVSAWSARSIVVLPLAGGARRTIPLDFLPDNIHPGPGGVLLVGGQRTDVTKIAACTGAVCAQPWVMAQVAPATGRVTPLIAGAGDATISYACGGIVEDGMLYVTARGDNRLIVAPYRPAAS